MTKARAKTDDEVVTGPVLAQRLGLTATSVSRLAANGKLAKAARGKYWLWKSVKMYIASVSESAKVSPVTAQRAELVRLQVQRQRLALDREAGLLIDAATIEHDMKAIFGALQRSFMGMPSRIGSEAGLDRAATERFRDLIASALGEFVNEATKAIPEADLRVGEAVLREARKGRKK